jgi:4-alpha-glucanotransferase
MDYPRASGILLHPTSLPGPFGIGDLGKEAEAFVDFLSSTGQRYWQTLPLGPSGSSDSPYQARSSLAGNTLLVSPERLLRDGLLAREDLTDIPDFPDDRVAFKRVRPFKRGLLARAYERFRKGSAAALSAEFDEFCRCHAAWLDDYALYRAIRDASGGTVWNRWDKGLARRDPAALRDARERLSDQVEAEKFSQFLFFRQWASLRNYCRQRGIRILGDVPIFVAHDSADVWTLPAQFKLASDGSPRVMAGVPPDYFSPTGQVWENPVYDWDRMKADGFPWWIARIRTTLELVDVARIDHFRGFLAYWEIPGGDRTAERGQWVPAPGRELFEALRLALGDLPLVAEDLGTITPDVDALRDACGFPGTRVLQFAFAEDSTGRDLPHNYPRNVVAYTGTHDNNTVVGWLGSRAGEDSTRSEEQVRRECELALKYVGCRDRNEIHWDFIRAIFASVAHTAIVPIQDVLGLGSEARMNVPGTRTGNWAWRLRPGSISDEACARLREMTELHGRLPSTP